MRFNCFNKNYHAVCAYCHYTGKYRGAAHSMCTLRCKPPNVIPLFFQNESTIDYHFIIKELAENFEDQSKSLGETLRNK